MSGGANVQLRTTHHPSLPLSSAAFMLTDIHHVPPEYVLPPILPCRCNQPQRRRFTLGDRRAVPVHGVERPTADGHGLPTFRPFPISS